MSVKVTPAKVSKKGSISLIDLSRRTGFTRQWLLQLFNKNRKAFDDLLIIEMEKDLQENINREIAAIRTPAQIKKEMNADFQKLTDLIKAM